MRLTCPAAVLALAIAAPSAMRGAEALAAPDLTVGRHLQKSAIVRLAKAAPQGGIELTLTSDDPKRLLLSTAPDKPGCAEIKLKYLPQFFDSPDFWVQALGDSGSVTYTATANGVGTVKGTVTLTPSSVVVIGPFKAPTFTSTPHGVPAKVMIYSVAVDSSGKLIEDQGVAGGTTLKVDLSNSNPAAGALHPAEVTIPAGSSEAISFFKPAGVGKTTIAAVGPPGFGASAEYANVTAVIDEPGLALVGDIFIGKNLQMPAVLCLGEAAPSDGLKVTLSSADPSKLLMAAKQDDVGSGSITITVPAGKLTAEYYLNALGDSGTVSYTGAAPGFRSRTVDVRLAPSGVIIAYESYGPPDEATVVRHDDSGVDERRFYASVAAAKDRPIHLVAWSAFLHPENGRAADATVQPLRPGVSATLYLKSSNPDVGRVESPLTIAPGSTHAVSRFTPLRAGETTITINTPTGFSTPKNATSVPATVAE